MRAIEDALYVPLQIYGHNIRLARQKQDLTLTELAHRIGYDRYLLSKIEYGEQNFKYKTAIKIAKELNIFFPMLFSRTYQISSNTSFIPDDYLATYIANINSQQLKNHTLICRRINICEETLSRLLNENKDKSEHSKRSSKNPSMETLSALSIVCGKELSDLFTRSK